MRQPDLFQVTGDADDNVLSQKLHRVDVANLRINFVHGFPNIFPAIDVSVSVFLTVAQCNKICLLFTFLLFNYENLLDT